LWSRIEAGRLEATTDLYGGSRRSHRTHSCDSRSCAAPAQGRSDSRKSRFRLRAEHDPAPQGACAPSRKGAPRLSRGLERDVARARVRPREGMTPLQATHRPSPARARPVSAEVTSPLPREQPTAPRRARLFSDAVTGRLSRGPEAAPRRAPIISSEVAAWLREGPGPSLRTAWFCSRESAPVPSSWRRPLPWLLPSGSRAQATISGSHTAAPRAVRYRTGRMFGVSGPLRQHPGATAHPLRALADGSRQMPSVPRALPTGAGLLRQRSLPQLSRPRATRQRHGPRADRP
jgi:hypothetical protein